MSEVNRQNSFGGYAHMLLIWEGFMIFLVFSSDLRNFEIFSKFQIIKKKMETNQNFVQKTTVHPISESRGV